LINKINVDIPYKYDFYEKNNLHKEFSKFKKDELKYYLMITTNYTNNDKYSSYEIFILPIIIAFIIELTNISKVNEYLGIQFLAVIVIMYVLILIKEMNIMFNNFINIYSDIYLIPFNNSLIKYIDEIE